MEKVLNYCNNECLKYNKLPKLANLFINIAKLYFIL